MNKSMFNSKSSSKGDSSLVELLRKKAVKWPNRRIFTYLDAGELACDHLTYEMLDQRARAIGALLQKRQLSGERALLLYPFGLDFISAFFGCLYGEVIAVPVPPPNPARVERTLPRLQAIAGNAQALVGMTSSEMMPMIKEVCGQTGLAEINWLATDKIDLNLAGQWKERPIEGQALAYLQYTSGSTKIPKGAMVSHENVLCNSDYISRGWRYEPESVSVVWVPYYHDDGLVHGIIQPVYRGYHAHLMSPLAFVQKPIRWLRAISDYRATHAGGPNFAYELSVSRITSDQCAGLDLSGWETAYNGAEPVRAQTLEKFAEVFGKYGFRMSSHCPSYGLAEATLLVAAKQHSAAPVYCHAQVEAFEREGRVVEAFSNDLRARTLVSCGSPVGETRIVIVNPNSLTKCHDNEVGEIWISDPGVVQGYWNCPEESEETFRAYLSDTGEGPFLRTGDLGFLRQGEVYVTGRIKDLVIIRGQNHYPQDLEWTVEHSHPTLRLGCTAAFPLDVDGEEQLFVAAEVDVKGETIAYEPHRLSGLIYREDLPVNVAEIVAAIQQAVALHHEVRVSGILLLEAGAIPKTSSGKIQRQACRAGFLNGSLHLVAAWGQSSGADETAGCSNSYTSKLTSYLPEAIQAWLTEQISERRGIDSTDIDVKAPLSHYHFNSEKIADLTSDLENWLACRLPQTLIDQSSTIETLVLSLTEGGWAALPLQSVEDLTAPDFPASEVAATSSRRATLNRGRAAWRAMSMVSPRERQRMLQFWMSAQLKRILKLTGPPPSPETMFNQLGLDSMMAVELTHRLEIDWGVIVPAVKVLQDTSIAQFVTWILKDREKIATNQIAMRTPPAAIVGLARDEPSDPEVSISSIERLTEDQLDSVLNRLLTEEERRR